MFKDRFMQTIQTKQITAYKVAKDTGISQGLMNEYKNGIKLPTVQNLVKIADYLNVSVDYLLGTSEEIGAKKAPTENDERDELVDAIMTIVKQLSPEQKEMLLAQLRGLAGQK